MTGAKLKRQVNGVTFIVSVYENDSKTKRKVTVRPLDEPMTANKTDVRTISWLQRTFTNKTLCPRSEHIADTLNEAVSTYFNNKEQEDELRDEIETVMDAADSVYSDENIK